MASHPKRFCQTAIRFSLGLSLLVLSGCLPFPDGDTPDESCTPAPDTVCMTSQSFQPASIIVPAGTTVTWINASPARHTVTFDPEKFRAAERVQLPAGVAPFGSEPLKPRETFRHTFTTPGVYRYICLPHAPYMSGTITVQ